MGIGLRAVVLMAGLLLLAGCSGQPSTQDAIQEAIAAMGGPDKVQSLQLIELHGSGEFNWLGENLKVGEPGHPGTLENLVEVYDYANDSAAMEFDLVSWYHTHRREVVTKFGEGAEARPVGYVWRTGGFPVDASEQAVMTPSALHGFAYHTSPETALRRSYLAILRDASAAAGEGQSTEEREFGGKTRRVATAKTSRGEPLELYFDPETKLLVGYEITETDHVTGDRRTTYSFDDFKPVDGVPIPHRVTIRGEKGKSADIEYTWAALGGGLAKQMLVIPEYLSGEAKKVLSGDYIPLQLVPVGPPGVFEARGYSHSTLVVEFPNWLALVDVPQSETNAKVLKPLLEKQFPEKPVRYVGITHPHHDHFAGTRTFAAWGSTVLVEKNHEAIIREIIDARHTYPPDELERARASQQKVGAIEVYEGKKVISDGGRTLELHAFPTQHAGTMVFAYVPHGRVAFGSDMGGKIALDWLAKENRPLELFINGHVGIMSFEAQRARAPVAVAGD